MIRRRDKGERQSAGLGLGMRFILSLFAHPFLPLATAPAAVPPATVPLRPSSRPPPATSPDWDAPLRVFRPFPGDARTTPPQNVWQLFPALTPCARAATGVQPHQFPAIRFAFRFPCSCQIQGCHSPTPMTSLASLRQRWPAHRLPSTSTRLQPTLNLLPIS